MEVICLESPAFYALLGKALEWAKESLKQEKIWVSAQEAMAILGIKSKATLQKLRNEGLIRFTQFARRVIQYEVASLYELLDGYANKRR